MMGVCMSIPREICSTSLLTARISSPSKRSCPMWHWSDRIWSASRRSSSWNCSSTAARCTAAAHCCSDLMLASRPPASAIYGVDCGWNRFWTLVGLAMLAIVAVPFVQVGRLVGPEGKKASPWLAKLLKAVACLACCLLLAHLLPLYHSTSFLPSFLPLSFVFRVTLITDHFMGRHVCSMRVRVREGAPPGFQDLGYNNPTPAPLACVCSTTLAPRIP
eukprot:scaffold6413_cov121-Isochrysis_galbana.AAC.8